jgi:uncharacterized protein YdeI (YjbR/CyaY-like superfamily)
MYFRTVILLSGKTATGIKVPEEVVAGLGSSKRPFVRVTKRFFNGLSYSNKRRIVIPIEEAKTADTRQRRIEKHVD